MQRVGLFVLLVALLQLTACGGSKQKSGDITVEDGVNGDTSADGDAPDSALDRRFGYHEAPDHPLYQDFELNWNGDWDYAVHIDKEQKVWTAELHVPFATLEVEAPKPGATWTMNIGRNQFPEGAETSRDAVVYLWSPNIQSRTFHDMSVFGELVFR